MRPPRSFVKADFKPDIERLKRQKGLKTFPTRRTLNSDNQTILTLNQTVVTQNTDFSLILENNYRTSEDASPPKVSYLWVVPTFR